MNQFLFIFLLSIVSKVSYGQKSFEGSIKFSTKISISKDAPPEYNDLPKIYGDSLIMYYSNYGNFKRIHLNTADFGNETQFYDAGKGITYFTYKNQEKDSLDMSKNSLKLLKKQQIANEKILKKNCECWEYDSVDYEGDYALITFCFSNKSPFIDSNLFSKHEDFFLSDFFQYAKHPYLKFSLKTKKFTLTYIAEELIEKKIDSSLFLK